MKIQDIFIQSDRLFSFQELRKDYFLCLRKVKSHGCCTQKDREEIAQTLVLNVLTDILPYLGSAQYTAHNSNSTKTNFMIQFRNQLNIKRHSSMCWLFWKARLFSSNQLTASKNKLSPNCENVVVKLSQSCQLSLRCPKSTLRPSLTPVISATT